MNATNAGIDAAGDPSRLMRRRALARFRRGMLPDSLVATVRRAAPCDATHHATANRATAVGTASGTVFQIARRRCVVPAPTTGRSIRFHAVATRPDTTALHVPAASRLAAVASTLN